MSKFFAKNLKFLRNNKKIKQQDLADKLNIDRSTVSRYENNEIEPTLENIIDIANVLGVPIADLVGKDMQTEGLYFDDLEELFLQNKELLTDDDKDTIRFIIEKRIKENDTQR